MQIDHFNADLETLPETAPDWWIIENERLPQRKFTFEDVFVAPVKRSYSKNRKADGMIDRPFGRLLVVSLDRKQYGNRYYLCKCECGQERIVCKPHLLSGKTKSCGCLRKEVCKNNSNKSICQTT